MACGQSCMLFNVSAARKKQSKSRIAVCVYMDEGLHRSLKAAAATAGMSMSAYICGRVLAGREIFIGDPATATGAGRDAD